MEETLVRRRPALKPMVVPLVPRKPQAFYPGAAFFSSALIFLFTSLLCVLDLPTPSSTVGDFQIPVDAKCVRATRHSNYVSVFLSSGSPTRQRVLLLRFETRPENQTLRLFDGTLAESKSVACNGDFLCRDVALLQLAGPTSPQTRIVTSFLYSNAATEFSMAKRLGLDGELFLSWGHRYWLTTTHLCWAAGADLSALPTSQGIAVELSGSLLQSSSSDLVDISPSSSLSCAEQDVTLFPTNAAIESTWLGITTLHSSDDVEDRRLLVEAGTACANNATSLARANSLWQFDCVSITCDTTPSLPLRRLATHSMILDMPAIGETSGRLVLVDEPRLYGLPQLNDSSAPLFAIVKLSLMVLAAAVIWARAAKLTARSDQLFTFCLRNMHAEKKPDPQTDTPLDVYTVLEDGAIGMVAIVARFAVTIWRFSLLLDDGFSRALVIQLLASFASLLLWIFRYVILTRERELPLTKIGGSTALCDSVSAVLLSFSATPLFETASSRFDSTARLLCALLLATTSLQRVFFAISCNGLLLQHSRFFDPEFVRIVYVSIALWIVQIVSISNLLLDVFATPLAHSISRNVQGGYGELAAAIALGCTATSLPSILKSVRNVAESVKTQ